MGSPRLLFELGRGGTGVVYLASLRGDGERERLVVVKRLRADLAADPESRAMLLREGRILARIRHPNVVETFDVGFEEGQYQLIMEWLDGQPLRSLVRASPALPVRHGVAILARTLAGLHAAHELCDSSGAPLGIVHRDVSPHNVLVTYDGLVKVLDFGIAKSAEGGVRTRTGMVKGKLTYMAPEQAARRTVDRRTDVFAAGVILWELLARRRFWGDSSEREIMAGLRRGVFEPPRAFASDAPAALEEVCLRAMAPDPSDRFATAEAMRASLELWLEQTGVVPSPAELGEAVTCRFDAERAHLAAAIDAARSRTAEPAATTGAAMSGFSATYSLVGDVSVTPAPTAATSPPMAISLPRPSRFPMLAAAALGLSVGVAAFGDPPPDVSATAVAPPLPEVIDLAPLEVPAVEGPAAGLVDGGDGPFLAVNRP